MRKRMLCWGRPLLIVGLLTSCIVSPTVSTTPPGRAPLGAAGAEPARTNDHQVLSVASIDDPQAANFITDLLVESYEARHQGEKVEIEHHSANYGQWIQQRAASGLLADVVFTADVFTDQFARERVVLDMQPLAARDADVHLADVDDRLLELGRVTGDPGLYMLPASFDAIALYYNRMAFEVANLPPPTDDWTWSDLVSACMAITALKDASGRPQRYCLSTHPHWSWSGHFMPWVLGYGGSLLSPDGRMSTLASTGTVEGLYHYIQLWTRYDIVQPIGLYFQSGDCFTAGKCAAAMFTPGYARTLRASGVPFKWGVVRMPSHPRARNTLMGAYGYAVSTAARRPDAAWDFVKQLITSEFQRELVRRGASVPVLKSLAHDRSLADISPFPSEFAAFQNSIELGVLQPRYPAACGSLVSGESVVEDAIRTALEASIRQQIAITDALRTADSTIQVCLDSAQR